MSQTRLMRYLMLWLTGLFSVPAFASEAAYFRAVAQAEPQRCAAADGAVSFAAAPLRGELRCAWSGRLQWQTWTFPSLAAQDRCVPQPARLWHTLTSSAPAPVLPWHAAWERAARRWSADGVATLVLLQRTAEGTWRAERWRWRPAPGAATRAWEDRHWERIARELVRGAEVPSPAGRLYRTWLDLVQRKDALIADGQWRWEDGGRCLTLSTAGISEAHLQLPPGRDDVRQEQRSAMQVQLVRSIPNVEWLVPFRLIEPGAGAPQSTAKFLAVWADGAAVRGQIWIPSRDRATERARISIDRRGASRSELTAMANTLQQQLEAFAHRWEALYE